ncbi:MAG TPA: hypothetical protein DCP11_12035 [Microbacteriaceae bacterium]|jgi:hypothetical protein|nr:hypothetical protein [Microbacteriaceae bacterium]
MELLFVTLGGAIIGLGLRYAFPGREKHGAALLPSIGAALAAVIWAALTWVGWKFDGGWIWVVSFVLTAAVSAVLAVAIGRRRTAADATMLATLSRA